MTYFSRQEQKLYMLEYATYNMRVFYPEIQRTLVSANGRTENNKHHPVDISIGLHSVIAE